MTIYGRTGDVVTLKRLATLEDVKPLEGREPDTQDLEALENGSYVVVIQDDGTERLYHQAFLRATGGSAEIGEAIDNLLIKAIAAAPSREPSLHVIDQSGQPYGSVRMCCNMCGIMATPGIRFVERTEDWYAVPVSQRCKS